MRIGVLTGGGDCPGLNAAIRSIAHRAWMLGDDVVGFREGWAGLLGEGNSLVLTADEVGGILHLGGTILGSSRTNPARNADEMRQVEENLRRRDLQALITIGGDDTLSVSAKLSERGFAVVGVPKTIDNDVPGTDYCIGFDSAVQVVGEALDRLHTTAEAHRRVMVVEVMGRDAGWLAMIGGIAGGADLILIPEDPQTLDYVVHHVQHRMDVRRFSIVVVAEGALVGNIESAESTGTDQFGHPRLAARGIGTRLAEAIEARTGIEARVTVLGHVQRGGSPSMFDRVLATRLGAQAVDWVHEGKGGVMAGAQGLRILPVPFADVLGHNRRVDVAFFRLVRQFAVAEEFEGAHQSPAAGEYRHD
ncbi:MAG TPA: ATP-dependent 6-phosphofructokinase [Dehalococcoidia bacterium]|nr:ATP-dependent 6-phosphofructokinase [Dehalococcoidia bacterium]